MVYETRLGEQMADREWIDKPENKTTRRLNGSPEFYRMLQEMADTHDRKSHDYANNQNPFGNYLFAGQVACLFSHSEQDAGFVGRLAEKIFRLANLEGGKKIALNESIEDTEKDICTIVVLWMACRRESRNKDKDSPSPPQSETQPTRCYRG